MTKNQLELIKAREIERANKAKEDLERRGQNIDAVTSGISTAFRGLGSTLLGNIMKGKGGTSNTYDQRSIHYHKHYSKQGGKI